MDKVKVAKELVKIAKGLVAVYGDPYWITVKWPMACKKCGRPIKKGEQAFYYPRTKAVFGDKCGHGKEAEADFSTQSEMDVF